MNEYQKGVYCLTNLKNGKRYVGIGMGDQGIESRFRKYRTLQCKGQSKILRALEKYGPENFKFEIVLKSSSVELAKRVEKQLIAIWNLQNDIYGYNILSGGEHQIPC